MAENDYPYEVGDLLEIVRNIVYSHWAIYKGNGEVYHLTFDLSKCNNATEYVERLLTKSVVRCDKLKDVAGKCKVVVSNKLDSILKARVKEEIIKEAKNKMGKEVYNIMFRNCESFVNMCRYGNPISLQIVFVVKILLALTIGYIARKYTIEFLEERFKMHWAAVQVAGFVTGAAVVVLIMTVPCVEDLVVFAVTKASFIWCFSTCAVAANFIIAICFCAAVIVKVVTSEPFKKIFKYSVEKMKQFFSALYNLVRGTISRTLQKE